ncbi:hypothetical protein B0B35_29715 [Pseudomonas aeruginosa]|uniref:hypothetical protein n=1 Tax=Pseudomonas aeruginosa TaxID=287 RepID=UPI00097E5AF0|nr:hypothetical protein [Pseudomonas aeruginosa]ONN17942.1 hypothetical protein B0B17_29770 [Pseudomonas aeruginosa]OOH01324.1 hypothetical protein B0B35_29715 [Pseudomonas aeruginosa]
MATKKPSETAARRNTVDHAAAETLANALADRPYGEAKSTPVPAAVVKKAKPISISLPPEVIQDLEDRVRANKLSGEGPRTVSGLIKEALKNSGYKI